MSAWKTASLGEIFDIARGGSPRPIQDYITDDEDGVNWISISDASASDKFITETKKRIRREGVSRSRMVKPGDFLLTNSMSFGRPYIMGTSGCIHDGWLVLSSKHGDVDQDYFFHLLGSDFIYAKFTKLAAGATVKNLNIDLVSGVEVNFPPLEEQRRIAAILDQAETLRTQRRQALAHLDTLTQSLFLEMFGDAVSEPNRWPLAVFDQIVKESRIGLVRGSQELDPTNPYPYLRMNAIGRDGELKLEGALMAKASSTELEEYRLRRGDFLFNTRNSRELVGKTALFRSDDLYLFNNNLLRVRFTDHVDPEYVIAAFKTRYVQSELELRKSGTTNVFAVYYKDLKSLPIPLPPIALQQTFATRIQAIEALKATHRTALAQLDALFASLQQRAFAGEL